MYLKHVDGLEVVAESEEVVESTTRATGEGLEQEKSG